MLILDIMTVSMLLGAVTVQVIFQKNNLGITSLVDYSIWMNATSVQFNTNAVSHIPLGYFKNLTNLSEIQIMINVISSVDSYAFAGKC